MSSPFQSSVLKKYLASLNHGACRAAYEQFAAHFGDQDTRDRISGLKEEEYQYGFLEDLFDRVFGYTLKPKEGYDLVVEQKNVKNSKKADGAILRAGEEVHAVIELKGTDTVDLNRVEAQAFGYKVAHPDCHYVITSNFARLRFYVDDTTASVEWNLFDLAYEHPSQPDFRLLYLLLAQPNLLADLPLKLRRESNVVEEEITKKLYKDYSLAKRELFQHLRERHPERDHLRLFQLTQKLLDRLLFVFFGEDKGLLPPNTASKPIGDFDKLRELDAGQPLYALLNKYFHYIDEGHDRDGWSIPAYNGGLFARDPELEDLDIPDPVLRKHLLRLTAYKFDSEIDVNILGHIFEHSLNEIEEVQAELRGEPLDKSKTKRKKDGIYYTPRYITKYIVANTVGRLCTEKKAELRIEEQDYARGRKGRHIKTIKALRQNLEAYRDWLLDLKICDPACGSGAFLNEALNFLIEEHNYVSELERQLFDAAIAFEPGPAILERNLYGVDINEESVEIAKLSLWLRTAERGRQLTDLSRKIKVGNSLIDEPAVAGDKAFVWAEEFPEVFGEGSSGGFDVVVGNPPYGASFTKEEKEFIKAEFHTHEYNYESYSYFFELSMSLIVNDGRLGFVVPNTFLVVENGEKLRRHILNNCDNVEIVEVFGAFADAVVEPVLYSFRKAHISAGHDIRAVIRPRSFVKDDLHFKCINRINSQLLIDRESSIWNYQADARSTKLYDRLSRLTRLSSIADTTTGVKPYQKGKGTPKQTAEVVKTKPFTSYTWNDASWQPLITGTEVRRYYRLPAQSYIQYGPWLAEPRDDSILTTPKIYIRRTDDRLMAALEMNTTISSNSAHYLCLKTGSTFNLNTVLGILNSNLMQWYFSFENFHMIGKPLAEIKVAYVNRLPIPSQAASLKPICARISEEENLQTRIVSFLRLVTRRLGIQKSTRKLSDWPSLDYAAFVKEINKLRKKAKLPKLTLAEDAEWEPHFHEQQAKVQALQADIQRLDREIDVLVYKLYGLTYEEVLVVDPEFWMGEGEYGRSLKA